MTLENIIITAALLASASALPACAFDNESEQVGEAGEALGPTGGNNVSPQSIDAQPLKRSITDYHGITSSSVVDPIQLCKGDTITSTGCTMSPQWEAWLSADSLRGWVMKGIAKCAVEPTFTIQNTGGTLSFPGQWGLYTSWKDNRLDSQDKRERMSSCILTLLNGNDVTLDICIIGPGGSPFSDACTDSSITTREAGFFGDLFAATPKAYVVGPNTDTMADTGRACTSSSGTSYCCAENDNTCPHHIYRAGAMQGPNARCDSFTTVTQGSSSYTYCNSFFTNREPGRTYSNVFTTFVPPLQ